MLLTLCQSRVSPRTRALFVLVIVLFCGVVLRVARLDDRPIYHDESIHATFGFYWYDHPSTGAYHYDPTYHGPLLYAVLMLFYHLFGLGIVQARLVPLAFNLALLFSPLWMRRFLGDRAAWVAVFFLAVSPLMTFYARFLAHDMPALVMIVGLIAALSWGRADWLAAFASRPSLSEPASKMAMRSGLAFMVAGGCLGLLFSIKAVAHLICAIFLSFWAFRHLIDRFVRRQRRRSFAWRRWVLPTGAFAAGFAGAYGIVQSAFFRFPDALADGIYGKVLSYWWSQHAIERLKGPFYYHARSLAVHELPLLLLAIAAGAMPLARRRWGQVVLVVLLGVLLFTVPASWALPEYFRPSVVNLFELLKVRTSTDVAIALACAVFGLAGTFILLCDGKSRLAFWNYFTFSAMTIFSFVGEKGPWLTVYVSLPATILVALTFWGRPKDVHQPSGDAVWARLVGLPLARPLIMAVAAGALVLQLHTAYMVSLVSAGQPDDLLSQVHNSRDVRPLVEWMERTAFEAGDRPQSFPIAIVGQPVWAFQFYMVSRGFQRVSLEERDIKGEEPFIITEPTIAERVAPRLEGKNYRKLTYALDGWWIPEERKYSWTEWAKYAWTRRALGPMGGNKFVAFVKTMPTGAVPPSG